jgi:hypothetical protein
MKYIKRSVLLKRGERLDLADPNDYILQYVRENPKVEIVNDLTGEED